jgi:release factor glutamine methyltransferase
MSGALTVGAAFELARAHDVARLDAQLLLARVLGCTRAWLLAHDDAVLDAEPALRLRQLIGRRAAGVPLAYVLGEKEFRDLTLHVSPEVLVPRPDTELLVDWAVELLHGPLDTVAHAAIVDLGTGSGAIALAVKHEHPSAAVTAVDVSPGALRLARANAARLGLAVEMLEGSWWQPLSDRRFHLVLCNPPYIAAGDAHLASLRHEPILALSPGGDGLGALREVIAGATGHLLPGGWLLLEHGFDQAAAVQELLHGHGLRDVQTRLDLGRQPRCTGAHL